MRKLTDHHQKWLLLFFVFLVLPRQVLQESASPASGETTLYVWNVGQGQWVTLSDNKHCYHFDVGGESLYAKNTLKKVLSLCRLKLNEIYISHGDKDHTLNLSALIRALEQSRTPLCRGDIPTDPIKKKTKWSPRFSDLTRCPTEGRLKKIYAGRANAKERNNHSQVYFFAGRKNILIPGDSPIEEEKIWSQSLWIRRTDVLVLGHHGSRTSTGRPLLTKLFHLKLAIASSRKIRYGHPHKETLQRLEKEKIPTVSTESWGDLKIEL